MGRFTAPALAKGITDDPVTAVRPAGRMNYDADARRMRFHDGETPGGLPMGPAGKVVDIADFGAKFDGSDDSAAIVAALATFSDYEGGELVIRENTCIAQTITIQNKKGIVIRGRKGLGFEFTGGSRVPTIKWTGAAGSTMFLIKNAIHLTMENLAISGEDVADYGLSFEGLNTGWGVGNYNYLTIYGCNKNCVKKSKDASAILLDFGRNHWLRCTFKKTAEATGTAKDDACYVYDGDSGVQDVFDHCQFIYKSAIGAKIIGGYSVWFEAGSPRVIFRDCYTVGDNGIFANIEEDGPTPTPILKVVRHYSEDNNFISIPAANTRQLLDDCTHVVSGGVSIAWGGSAGGGAPIEIRGGVFYGSTTLANTNAGALLNGAPQFVGGWPTISNGAGLVQNGRATGTTASVSQGANNAAAFVPYGAKSTTGNINFNLRGVGTVLYHELTQHATVAAPTAIDANGLDLYREIEFQIKGHASTTYNVTFNAVYQGVSGYTHSGPGITDVLRFRYMTDYDPAAPSFWWELVSLQRNAPVSTGWAADTIAADKDALAALSLPVSDPPTQAEMQAVVTAVQELRQQMAGVKGVLRTVGFIAA